MCLAVYMCFRLLPPVCFAAPLFFFCCVLCFFDVLVCVLGFLIFCVEIVGFVYVFLS